LYICGQTPSCICYLYSFSGYRAKKSIFLYSNKTETQQYVYMCKNCCRLSTYILLLKDDTHSTCLRQQVRPSTYVTQRALTIDCPFHCTGWPLLTSLYTSPSSALQVCFEFGSVVGLAQLTLYTPKLAEDSGSYILGFY